MKRKNNEEILRQYEDINSFITGDALSGAYTGELKQYNTYYRRKIVIHVYRLLTGNNGELLILQ